MFGLKIFKYLLKVPTLIFVVAFVVLNRQETTLYFSPISDPITLPLWIMGLILFGVGFTTGALLLWLNSFPTRKELRTTQKKLKTTEQDLENLKNDFHDKAIDNLDDNQLTS